MWRKNGRPGPVLIDLPRDIVVSPCPLLFRPSPLQVAPPARQKPGFAELNQAPYVDAQGQAPGDPGRRRSYHRPGKSGAKKPGPVPGTRPVACTLMGLGSFPSEDGLSLGMPGMHGSGYANLAIYESDLLLVAGARLDDRVTGRKDGFAPFAKTGTPGCGPFRNKQDSPCPGQPGGGCQTRSGRALSRGDELGRKA